MAVIAGIATENMRWVLARRDRAVMTGIARTDDLCVVYGKDRCKYVGVVAVLADVTGLNVSEILANGIGAIVTVDTVADNVEMIKVCGQPADR